MKPKERFIPARAGNMGAGTTALNAIPVHPRTCGEHFAFHAHGTAELGSSPHVRGTCHLALYNGKIKRFIPARAGNI